MTLKTKKKEKLYLPYCPHIQGFCTNDNLPCLITFKQFYFSGSMVCKHLETIHPITGNQPSLAIIDDIIK